MWKKRLYCLYRILVYIVYLIVHAHFLYFYAYIAGNTLLKAFMYDAL